MSVGNAQKRESLLSGPVTTDDKKVSGFSRTTKLAAMTLWSNLADDNFVHYDSRLTISVRGNPRKVTIYQCASPSHDLASGASQAFSAVPKHEALSAAPKQCKHESQHATTDVKKEELSTSLPCTPTLLESNPIMERCAHTQMIDSDGEEPLVSRPPSPVPTSVDDPAPAPKKRREDADMSVPSQTFSSYPDRQTFPPNTFGIGSF